MLLKKVIGFGVASLAVLLIANSSNISADVVSTTKDEEINVAGGWDESTGYFQNYQAYSNVHGSTFFSTGTPRHTGKREETVINGTTHFRAHGWTTWRGVYHYTRARMEYHGGGVATDSGRKYGWHGTEAISPWHPYNPKGIGVSARTYYGKDD